MLPTLKEGDSILVEYGYYEHSQLCNGDIVLVEHPHKKDYIMVKRIASFDSKLVWIEGDNPSQSTDSRHFGPVSRCALRARVWSRF